MGKLSKTTITFDIDWTISDKVDDHVDKTKIELRKVGVKFTRREMFQYWVESGLDEFDMNRFQKYLKNK